MGMPGSDLASPAVPGLPWVGLRLPPDLRRAPRVLPSALLPSRGPPPSPLAPPAQCAHVTPCAFPRGPRASPEPEAPSIPRHLGQPPPAPALGRSVQAPAEPPQQRLRKAVEGRAGRSRERRPRGRSQRRQPGRGRLPGRGRRGLRQLAAQRRVPRRRPRDCRRSRRPHLAPRLQRTFRLPPSSPKRRGGRGGRTNRAAPHRTQRRKLGSPPHAGRFAWGKPGRPAAPATPRGRDRDGAGPRGAALCACARPRGPADRGARFKLGRWSPG